jgi:hypothetical protein
VSYWRTIIGPLWPEINSRECLCVPQGPRHNAGCCFAIQLFIFLMFCLVTPKKGSGPVNHWPEPLLASLSAISFPLTLAWPGTQNSPTTCRVEMSFNACWHCRNKGDVHLVAWSAFKAAFPRGKGGRYMRLTTLPPSHAECHGIWEPKPPGTLWTTPGLLRESFPFNKINYICTQSNTAMYLLH